ncbi:MAG: SDR family oxidoreductase [Actinomycetota bacterium]|nr:SDR family oxidoreductase [Actinomycetota bacterium]
MTASFEGKTALVTGGTRGIGFGIAAEIVAGGGVVCITARKPDELAEAVERLGGEDVALAVRGSADDAAHRADAVAQTVKRFGSLDLLVNNAAVNPHYGPVMEAPLDAVRKVFEVNVTGMLAWAQEAWKAWMAEHGGAVLNVASVGGVRNGPMIGVYNISKAAVIHMTRQMGQEMGPGVRVNAIAPAVVKTDFAKALYEGREEKVAAAYPLKRLGRPEDTAKLAAFLLSDDASWITGETVVIDGGVTVAG